MRKNYMFILLLTVSSYANAQLTKNSFLVGGRGFYGNENYTTANTNERETRTLSVFLSGGKAVKDDKVIGLIASYSRSKQEDEIYPTSSHVQNNYELGFFFRQYKQISKRFSFYGEADLIGSVGRNKSGLTGNKITANSHGARLSVAPAVAYRICENVQVELAIADLVHANYSRAKTTDETPVESQYERSSFSINTNLKDLGSLGNFALGVQLTLN